MTGMLSLTGEVHSRDGMRDIATDLEPIVLELWDDERTAALGTEYATVADVKITIQGYNITTDE